MSKISCVAAALNVRWTFVKRGPERSVDKARVSCGFANVRGVVMNSYNPVKQTDYTISRYSRDCICLRTVMAAFMYTGEARVK